MNNPFGQIKSKAIKLCTICQCIADRRIAVNIYENTPEAIEAAKQQIKQKAAKPYTCRICNSIQNSTP